MGDRGNVVIRDGGDDVWLYSHWGGYGLPRVVQDVIKKGARLNDGPYLARIMLNEMQGNDRGETGFGISARMCDNEHPIILVDVDTGTVSLCAEPKRGDKPEPMNSMVMWKFTEFVKLAIPEDSGGEDGWPPFREDGWRRR